MTTPDPPSRDLLGRTTLLAEVTSLLADGHHVLLTGRAGAGKTRFAEELVAAVSADGRRVEQVMASQATAAFQLGAFGPVAGLSNADIDDVPSLLNVHLSRWRSLTRQRRPVLLVIDDVHHLDGLSAVLCRHGIAAGVIQLLVTHRALESLPADITALLTSDDLTTVDVPSLTPEASADLARDSSERPLTDAEIEQIHSLSDGLPLFIRDLARSFGSGGSGHDIHRSHGLHEVLSNLPPKLRLVAELIAVAEPMPIRTLSRYRIELSDLMARGVARRQGEDEVRLEHPLYSAWLVDALGPRVSDVFDELVTCSEGIEISPTRAADWRIRAGRSLDPNLAVEAMQSALVSSDAATALRLIPHMGEGSEVLAAQAIMLGGDLDDGLARLHDVRLTSADVTLRTQAAGIAARHVGLTKGDVAAARAILAEADDDDLDPVLRAPLLVGKLWLSFFGGTIVREDIELVTVLLDDSSSATGELHELLVAAVSLASLIGPSQAEPLLHRLSAIEGELGIEGHSGSSSGEGWAPLFDGDGVRSLDVFAARFGQISRSDDNEGLGLLGGSGGYAAALCGAIQLSISMSSAAVEASSPVDWFGFGHLADLMRRGSLVLAGRAGKTLDPPPEAPGPPIDIAQLLTARAESLWAEAVGRAAPGSTMLAPLELLASHLKCSWVLVGVAELADHRSDRAIHELAIESLSAGAPTERTYAALVDLAHARLTDDAEGMVAAGERFESFGFVSAAARAYADALRLADEVSELRHRGVQGLARCLLSWDGGAMCWTSDLMDIPTPRQLVVAHRSASGLAAGEIAAELVLSKRTVENHLYRATRLLGVSGRDELAEVLAPRGFGARIVPAFAT